MAQYELSLSDYWGILRKHLWLVVSAVVVLLGAAAFYVDRQAPVYRASSKVKLQKAAGMGGAFFEPGSYYENPVISESRVIESRAIAEKIVRRLHPPLDDKHLLDPAQVDEVQGSLSAEPVSETNIITITATGGDASMAARIANLAAEAYIDFNLSEKNKQARQVREFVEAQLTQTEVRLRSAEDALKRMREQGRATGMATVLENRIADVQQQMANLMPRLTEAHPDAIRMKEQLQQLQGQREGLPEAELEYARLNRDVQVNEKTYRELRERLEEARLAEAEKIADASIIELARTPGGPVSPRKELALLVGGLLGLLVGCVLAFVLEGLDTSIGTIEDVERLLQVPVLAVIPHLGSDGKIESSYRPHLRMFRALQRKKGQQAERMTLQAHYQPHSVASEAYRILRTNLKFSPERKVVLVTSAGPGEGKTTAISNLAIVTAQSGARTLVVSSDLRRPQLDVIFGVSKSHGLTEVLRGDLPLERARLGLSDFILGKFGYEEAVKNPYLENLSLIAAGRIPENPAELIGSKAMPELIARLREQFDVVLLDGPPILPIADSLLMAPMVDGIVLVYEVGRISRAALLRAKVQLDGAGGKLLGVVLNHIRPEVQTNPHYYYYAYRGYSAKEPAPAPKPKAAAS
jgi:tyrosine-protein kinase Etk/Wzc